MGQTQKLNDITMNIHSKDHEKPRNCVVRSLVKWQIQRGWKEEK